MSGEEARAYSLDDVIRMREQQRDPWADRIEVPADDAPAEIARPVPQQLDVLLREWADLSALLGNLCRQLEPIIGDDGLAVSDPEPENPSPDLHGTSHLIRCLHSLATDIRSARRELQSFINRIEV